MKQNQIKNAICVCIHIHGEEKTKTGELVLLSTTADYKILGNFDYKQAKINSATYISKGHLENLIEKTEELGAKYIIFDNEMNASQIANIEEMSHSAIRTRTEIILEIFSRHAKTKIAKLQVELAMLEFEYPKLKGKWSHLSRIEGGIGIRGGPGETQLEYDRRKARNRITKMKEELARLEKSVSTSRKGRKDAYRISIVGYTNAGKSSLFNTLCQSDSYVQDKLFATLEPKSRKLYLADNIGKDVILSDTIGFIDRLPHTLVASFKSTLSDASESDLIIHLIDASDEDIDSVMSSVETVLEEINSANIKRITVFNKTDAITEEKYTMLKRRFPEALFISVLKKENIDKLKGDLLDNLIHDI